MHQYRDRLSVAITSVADSEILAVARILSETRMTGSRVWIIGNGGSATTADHFATDLLRCADATGAPLRAVSLCSNQGIVTATANDFGFENIFVRQLQSLAAAGDVLISISASGNSPSIVDAIKWAQDHSILTLALTGFDGGSARRLADLSIHVESALGDYGVCEDVHLSICHMISEILRAD